MLVFRIFLYIVIVISAVFHEFFHAWTANQLGDPTAKYAGRLTLNPIKHIDPMWTVFMPLLLLFMGGPFIGMAKPVPYNPHGLRDQKWGSTKVAFSGPLANILIAFLFALTIRFLPIQENLYCLMSWIIYINIFLALFNLIPIPPLDGSKIIMDRFPKFFEQISRSPLIGLFVALIIAFLILPYIAQFVYFIFAGAPFIYCIPF